MNINSINELTELKWTDLSAANADVLSNVSKAYADTNKISTSDISGLNQFGFHSISCIDEMNIEVSYKVDNYYKSCKFNLGKALNYISQTLAWIAYLNIGSLTKLCADQLYVPFSGNLGENDKWISGLKIKSAATSSNTALCVAGSSQFILSTALQSSTTTLFEVIADQNSPKVVVENGTLEAKTNVSCELENASIYNLSAGKYRNDWNMKIHSLDAATDASAIPVSVSYISANGKFNNLTAENAIINSLSAGANNDRYFLCANSTSAYASNLSIAALTSLNNIATNLCVNNLYAGAYGIDINTNDTSANLAVKGTETIKVQKLSSANLSAQNCINSNLSAGKNNKLIVEDDNEPIKIENIAIKNIYAGLADYDDYSSNSLLNVKSDDLYIKIKKLQVSENDGLSAAGIAQLTAAAACWA